MEIASRPRELTSAQVHEVRPVAPAQTGCGSRWGQSGIATACGEWTPAAMPPSARRGGPVHPLRRGGLGTYRGGQSGDATGPRGRAAGTHLAPGASIRPTATRWTGSDDPDPPGHGKRRRQRRTEERAQGALAVAAEQRRARLAELGAGWRSRR